MERIKFYADTPMGEKNKYFCFKTSLLALEETIKRFLQRGYIIRSAWYESIDTVSGEVLTNSRISSQDLQRIFDEWIDEARKAEKKRNQTGTRAN